MHKFLVGASNGLNSAREEKLLWAERYQQAIDLLPRLTTDLRTDGLLFIPYYQLRCYEAVMGEGTIKSRFRDVAKALGRYFLYAEERKPYQNYASYIYLTVPHRNRMPNVVSPLILVAEKVQREPFKWSYNKIVNTDGVLWYDEGSYQFYFCGNAGRELFYHFQERLPH